MPLVVINTEGSFPASPTGLPETCFTSFGGDMVFIKSLSCFDDFHGIIPFSYILLLNRREIINNRGIGA